MRVYDDRIVGNVPCRAAETRQVWGDDPEAIGQCWSQRPERRCLPDCHAGTTVGRSPALSGCCPATTISRWSHMDSRMAREPWCSRQPRRAGRPGDVKRERCVRRSGERGRRRGTRLHGARYRLRSYSTGERRGFPATSDPGPGDFCGDTGWTKHMPNLHRIRRHVHSAEAPGLGLLPVHAGRQRAAHRQMGAVEGLQHLGEERVRRQRRDARENLPPRHGALRWRIRSWSRPIPAAPPLAPRGFHRSTPAGMLPSRAPWSLE
jgi:hypothetical protein